MSNSFKELEDLKSVSVGIDNDEKGYIDKQCPSEECEFLFKVNNDDWLNIFKDEAVWCPMCRHEAPSDQWFTIAQIEHAQKETLTVVEGLLGKAFSNMTRNFNQGQSKNSFVSISMKYKGSNSRTFTIPAKAAEAMELDIKCEKCHSRFSVLGSAFFCPACGHNSVTQTFSDSLRKIKAKIDNIDVVRKALTTASSKDEAELTCRSLQETCISDGVVAFQKLCEGLYEAYGKAPFNAFQRLEQGSELWEKAIKKGYADWLTSDQITKLNILFQKRHLLAHNEGIVDEKYITKSGDSVYKVGQRIVVSPNDIESLLAILKKLSEGLIEGCGVV
ncbi:hypothetical protein [Sulfurimonas sp. HSL3-2]|uniref:hypothetical protein n=1 Tax=Hydrocurvibacter mobilis TaxID=3131936 RepID=UPI0031F8E312